MSHEHLVLLPGLDGTGKLFAPFIAALPNHFQTSVVSYPPDELLTTAQHLEFIEAALPANQPYTLIAESFSGPLALRFAATRPARLKAIILVATFVTSPLPEWLRWIKWFVNPPLFSLKPPAFALRHWLLDANCSDELVRKTQTTIQSVTPEVLAHRLRMALEADERESLRTCEVPILYLQAMNDRLTGRRGVAGIQSVRPDIQHIEINAPHLLLQCNPAGAIEAIERFLTQINQQTNESRHS